MRGESTGPLIQVRRETPVIHKSAAPEKDYFERAALHFIERIHLLMSDRKVGFHFKESYLNTLNLYSSSLYGPDG